MTSSSLNRPTPKTPIVTLTGVLASLGLASCAGYGGATLLRLPVEVSPSRYATVRTPDAIKTATGVRFHGSVCRSTSSLPPTHLRVERIGADGAVADAASRTLWGLGGRGRRCSFYDVTTDWTLGAAEHVRVCAGRSDAPCPQAQRPPS